MVVVESSGIDVLVDTLLLRDFNMVHTGKAIELSVQLPFGQYSNKLRSNNGIRTVIDGKERTFSEIAIPKHNRLSLRFSEGIPTVRELLVSRKSEYVVQPLAVFASDFFKMFKDNFGEESFSTKGYILKREYMGVHSEGDLLFRLSRVRGLKDLTGKELDNVEINNIHKYLLSHLDSSVYTFVVWRIGNPCQIEELKYGNIIPKIPDDDCLIYIPFELQTPVLKSRKSRLRKKYNLQTNHGEIRFNSAQIFLDNSVYLGNSAIPIRNILFSKLSRYVVASLPASLPASGEVLTALYARFTGDSPGIQRQDDVITPNYHGMVVEQLQDAKFWNMGIETTLPKETTIRDVLGMEVVPVKLRFSYEGKLYSPQIQLPTQFGEDIFQGVR